jgi:FkbM family methyltransferase
MKVIHYLNRPEYLFRPKQIYHRALLSLQKIADNPKDVLLPWGVKIRVGSNPDDKVAYSIWLQGMYDLSLTEVIWRLLTHGETALDIGANIGYVTSLMASKVGKSGKVISFEPNPQVYQELCKTIDTWRHDKGWVQIELLQLALSNQPGEGLLAIPHNNSGEAALVSKDGSQKLSTQSLLQMYSVPKSRLDEAVKVSRIDLLKVDVEGHEFEVLEGAGKWISGKRIRDIVFEEHGQYPTKVTEYLESHGYRIFRIRKGFCKPLLTSPKQQWHHPWEPPNYLATINPNRALQLLGAWGWRSCRTS